jgi:hypothetical protein
MRIRQAVLGLVGLTLLAGAASTPAAAQFFTNSTGLVSPAATITFSEVVVVPGTLVTNQFAAYGATFTNLEMTPPPFNGIDEPNITFPDLGNFNGNGSVIGPITISFSTLQTSVAFAVIANDQPTFFDALRGGAVVASGSAPTETRHGKFVGFTGITFDAIRFAPAGGVARIDNLQFGTSSVPEPSPLIAATFGAGGLALLCANRTRKIGRK